MNLNLLSNKKKPETKFLNKKRKSHNPKSKIIKEKDNVLQYNNLILRNKKNISEEKSDCSSIDDEKKINEINNNQKNDENSTEKEILSLLEEGKVFLSLFKDPELLNEFESQSNTSDDSNTFIKSILLSYNNGDMLKNYLDVLNGDFAEFHNCLSSLMNVKNNFDNEKSNKFITKFSIMNNIILGKEKCNFLIDKIVIKLKQLILEYNYIKKVLNSFDANKVDVFQKFKDIMTQENINHENGNNYVNGVKNQLQNELNNELILGKVQNDKEK